METSALDISNGRICFADRLTKGRSAMVAAESYTYTEADRFRDLVTHARDGSPIATEAVRAQLRTRLSQASPRVILELAERLMQINEKLSA